MTTIADLTPKQEAFVRYYLGEANMNGGEAARLAGYQGGDSACYKQASLLVRNGKIRRRIQQALSERAMSPEEILARLSDVARGSLDDFVDVDELTGQVFLNMRKAKQRGLMHTFESVEYSDKGRLKIKRYSALDALDKLARVHKLFGEAQILPVQVDVKVLNVILDALPEEQRRTVIRALDRELQQAGD